MEELEIVEIELNEDISKIDFNGTDEDDRGDDNENI